MAQNSSTNPATGGATSLPGGDSTSIPGSTGNDQLSGGGSNDTITGLAGDDRLSGDAPLVGQWRYSVYDRQFSNADNQTSLIGDAQSTLVGHGYVDDFNAENLRNTLGGTPLTQNRNDFGVIYDSSLQITTGGVYTFATRSDDGSRLIIRDANGAVVLNLNNDRDQSANTASAPVTLQPGLYSIEIRYWENSGASVLSGTVQGPGAGAPTVDLATSPLITTPLLATGHVDGDDSILGDAGNDTITGGGGNDRLFGGADVDSILGEAGRDFIDGGAGNDRLFGGTENDTIDGGTNDDFIDGGDGNDSLVGNTGADSIEGGIGSDSIAGGTGDDRLFGGADADSILGDAGSDLIDGGAGTDSLFGGADNDRIDGGIDSDTIQGGTGFDSLVGNDGNDSIDGGADNDSIFGGAGNDTVFSDSLGSGTDSIFGGDGDDSLMFGDGDDSVYGGSGDDTIDDRDLINLTGTNLLYGGDGNDIVWAGFGNDSVFGDAGNDNLQGEQDNDSIYGGAGVDTMSGDTGNDWFFYAQNDVVTGPPNAAPAEFVFGGESNPNNNAIDFDTLDLSGLYRQYGWARVVIQQSAADVENGVVEIRDAAGVNIIATIVYDDIEDIIRCFTPGTMILTERGEVAVEDLVAGDLVMTLDNGLQPLRWIGRQHLPGARLLVRPELQPVRIAAGALGGAGPSRSMLVSPQHRLLVTGALPELLFGEPEVLVPAVHLVGHADVTRAVPEDGVTYVHILFDRHEIVRSDGIWTESFQPAIRTLSAMEEAVREEVLAIFPELMSGSPAHESTRPSLKAHETRVLFAR
jgi:Ca2+-binding RTX toxin-like protein